VLYLARPRYENRIWGSLPSGEGTLPVGEIWWVYQDDSGSTSLKGPDGRCSTVADLVSRGRLPGDTRYPVLLKTLHTADRLSVQVHPGAFGGPLFKEETWIVLDAEDGAWMMGGLIASDRESFVRAVDDGTAGDLLMKIPLWTGEAYHIPPGTVHALGPGLTVLEVQSNCNVTYRLYDWGRLDNTGASRELHIEEGTDAVDWSSPAGPIPLCSEEDFRQLAASYSILQVQGDRPLALPGGSVFFLSSGEASVEGDVEAPACLLADSDGGEFDLRGRGYVIEPGRDG